jgi:cobalt/nickel transport protein
MARGFVKIALSCLAFLCATSALAHFGAVIPSTEVVEQGGERAVRLEVSFIHPMEGHSMKMERPVRFGVLARGEKTDLTGRLTRTARGDGDLWSADYLFKRPGDHIFFLEPAPYWEPAEDSFIVHYTKVVVNGFGLETGWDAPVGFEVEIMPLTRPYGLWAGNIFTGMVLKNGAPLADCEVEVEYLNSDRVNIPASPFVTQVVKTDGRGIFSYAMPRAGWWGFAALAEGTRKIEKDGSENLVELGGVLWVRTREMSLNAH